MKALVSIVAFSLIVAVAAPAFAGGTQRRKPPARKLACIGTQRRRRASRRECSSLRLRQRRGLDTVVPAAVLSDRRSRPKPLHSDVRARGIYLGRRMDMRDFSSGLLDFFLSDAEGDDQMEPGHGQSCNR